MQSDATGSRVCESRAPCESPPIPDCIGQARLVSRSASRGTWNMALDEALVASGRAGGPPTLRFYQWDQPTLSLGYFQRYADRAFARDRACTAPSCAAPPAEARFSMTAS